MSKYSETKHIKNLPYTVTGIPYVDAWRKERADKEAVWQIAKEVKRQNAINAFNRGVSSYEGTISKATVAHRRAAISAHEARLKSKSQQPIEASNKLNPIKSTLYKVLDWFLAIKF